MAIGCAKCMGYELPVNFNLPYISHNVSEFWKQWHISLSSWLMQYLYIPLGGNRKGRIRTYVNLMITMLLGDSGTVQNGALYCGVVSMDWLFVSIRASGNWLGIRKGRRERKMFWWIPYPSSERTFLSASAGYSSGRKCAEGMAGIKTVIWLPGGHYTSVQLCHCSNYYSLHCNSGCIS